MTSICARHAAAPAPSSSADRSVAVSEGQLDRVARPLASGMPSTAEWLRENDLDTMKQEIAANAKLKEDNMVFLQGDQNVPFSRIVDVLVAIKGAEIENVGFVAKPDGAALRRQTP